MDSVPKSSHLRGVRPDPGPDEGEPLGSLGQRSITREVI